MIITCPHCQTKYQVTYEAIGSAGRKVQCAQCRQAWQQRPLDETNSEAAANQAAFEAIAEDGLDEAMMEEERAVAAEVAQRLEREKAAEAGQRAAAKVDPALMRKRQRAFSRRQSAMAAELPLARLRRTLRVVGLVTLMAVLAIAYFGRVQVVERFPAMAGLYESVGLGVNVVGLDFSNVTTLRKLRDGKEMLIVSAQITGLDAEPVPVPPVVVTLLNDAGQAIYEWSVTPSVRDLMAGERSTFDTQLALPPGQASRVRLSFAGGHTVPLATASPTPMEHAEPAHGAVAAEPAAHAAPPAEHPSPEHH